MTEPVWLSAVQAEAGRLLGLGRPLAFPGVLLEAFASGTEVLLLDADLIPESPDATPEPEFGVLGADMPDYFVEYDFARYLPGAWPIALDGGAGLYCLDLRAAATDSVAEDGPTPLVWSHAGNLGWEPDEHVRVAADAEEFLTAAVVERR